MKGNPVQSGGVAGRPVKGIQITDDGHADITMSIDGDYAPLRRGTRAGSASSPSRASRTATSTSRCLPNADDTIPDGGVIDIDKTATPVDLDQLFNTLDPPTRKALQDFFKGSADQLRNMADEANVGFQYLNPALSTSRRLFNELTKDTPLLQRFLVDSSQLVTALAERRDDLAGLIGNLNTTTRALGNQKEALAESIGRLPAVHAPGQHDVREPALGARRRRPARRRLEAGGEAPRAVPRQPGPFAADAEPDGPRPRLSDPQSRRGQRPDRPDADASRRWPTSPVDTKNRTLRAGRHARTRSATTRGAFPETVEALKGADGDRLRAPLHDRLPRLVRRLLDHGRRLRRAGAPRARGFNSRSSENFACTPDCAVDGRPKQYKRCPGAAEAPAPATARTCCPRRSATRLDCDESRDGDAESEARR